MKLTFSILWFEDDQGWKDSLDTSQLQKEIQNWGFAPNIKFVSTPEEFKSHSPFQRFDLIVIDRTLEGHPEGEEFINLVRQSGVYTEVIFYTAAETSSLWAAIHEKKLEGVYVSNRTDVLTKITVVGEQAIKKVLDLENMRGIVMAEVGEMDLILGAIITKAIERAPAEKQSDIFGKFVNSSKEYSKELAARLEAFAQSPTVALMLEMCDSNKRWSNFNRVASLVPQVPGNEIGDYVTEVLIPRNVLAHGIPRDDGKGGFIFNHNGKDHPFDEQISLGLRQTILRYKKAYSAILAAFDTVA